MANDIPNPRPLQAPKTFADVQSGDVDIVVVECVRPPRRRTLCKRRDLVIIQAALSAAVQAELVTEGLVRRAGAAPSRIVLDELVLAAARLLSARQELHSALVHLTHLASCETL